MGIVFCEKCDNIMIFERKFGNKGQYMCRGCGFIDTMKPKKLELIEKLDITPVGSVKPRRELN